MSDKKDDSQLDMFQGPKLAKASTTAAPDILTHRFGSMELRCVVRGGEPWFFAVDVCKALDIQNTTDALTRLDDDEKSNVSSPSQNLGWNIISESGLHAIVLRSNKPEAKAYRKWVTSEVLPAIRRAGRYEKGAPATDGDKFALIKMAMDGWAADREKLAAQSHELAIARPAVAQIARIERSVGDESIQTIGKELGVAPNFLFDFLAARGAIFRRGVGGPWKPTAAQINAGRFDMKPYIDPKTGRHYPQTLVTPKGLVWIASLLDEAGIKRKGRK